MHQKLGEMAGHSAHVGSYRSPELFVLGSHCAKCISARVVSATSIAIEIRIVGVFVYQSRVGKRKRFENCTV